ncbi:penicillin acylase family protein [Pseudokineococcus sp. 5B2Z-1]|uniref:penicillin acylase family protein n=1 Tax=Pseudokineococcus sp. 5B2Z-1 TaxID=3132744 RepID=UPI0030948E7A
MTASVRRDAHGVPTVEAGSLEELAHAQGRVTAHDRAWQLESERWRAEGALAAHVGPSGLAWDVLARRVRLPDTARRCYAALEEPVRRFVAAYAEGVAAGLPEGAARSPELRALGLAGTDDGGPADGGGPGEDGGWQPWTPLAVLLSHHLLFGSVGTKLWREHVVAAMGPELGPDLAAAFAVGPPDGSNALAVAGSRTASGLPLVAGDPHRLLERPGVYQQVHLVCAAEGVDVVGLAFPGVPGVPHFGHAGSVAWAVTNAMADYQDLLLERLRVDGRDEDGGPRLVAHGAGGREEIGPEGWEPVERRTEVVAVAGAEPVRVDVVETARGPLLVLDRRRPDAPAPAMADGEEVEGLALRAPSRVLADAGAAALPALLRARTADDVERAWGAWVEPVNSVLVADTSGAVRRLVAGRVPRRAERARWRPVPADDPAWAWTGWEEHPALRVAGDGAGGSPEADAGVVVTANDERPDVAHLGTAFAPPHRARRLRALVGDRTGLAVDDLAATLVDTAHGSAPALLALLRRVARAAPTAGPAHDLLERALAWDGRADPGSTGAAAAAAWRAALARRVVALPLLAPLHRPPAVPAALLPWLSPVERVGAALPRLLDVLPAHGVDVGALALAALEDAAAAPAGAAGATWGDLHRLRTVHGLDGTPWHDATLRPGEGSPLPGDTDCVVATASVPGLSLDGLGDTGLRGPVARYVWDLADRGASRWVVPLGADGVQGALHAADQLPLWLAGRLAPVPPTRPDDAVDDGPPAARTPEETA